MIYIKVNNNDTKKKESRPYKLSFAYSRHAPHKRHSKVIKGVKDVAFSNVYGCKDTTKIRYTKKKHTETEKIKSETEKIGSETANKQKKIPSK